MKQIEKTQLSDLKETNATQSLNAVVCLKEGIKEPIMNHQQASGKLAKTTLLSSWLRTKAFYHRKGSELSVLRQREHLLIPSQWLIT